VIFKWTKTYWYSCSLFIYWDIKENQNKINSSKFFPLFLFSLSMLLFFLCFGYVDWSVNIFSIADTEMPLCLINLKTTMSRNESCQKKNEEEEKEEGSGTFLNWLLVNLHFHKHQPNNCTHRWAPIRNWFPSDTPPNKHDIVFAPNFDSYPFLLHRIFHDCKMDSWIVCQVVELPFVLAVAYSLPFVDPSCYFCTLKLDFLKSISILLKTKNHSWFQFIEFFHKIWSFI